MSIKPVELTNWKEINIKECRPLSVSQGTSEDRKQNGTSLLLSTCTKRRNQKVFKRLP